MGESSKVPWVEWDQALGGRVVGAGAGGVHGRGRLSTYMDLGQGGGAFWAAFSILASACAHFWPESRDLCTCFRKTHAQHAQHAVVCMTFGFGSFTLI